ncbi:MAG: hypothetical protein WCD16_05415 [Paracoccaceae bacterium]
MKAAAIVFTCVALVAPAAGAQSQLARSVMHDLRLAGVSDACIARLGTHDFARIKGIRDAAQVRDGDKRQRIKFVAEQACGETRSIIRDIFTPPPGRGR